MYAIRVRHEPSVSGRRMRVRVAPNAGPKQGPYCALIELRKRKIAAVSSDSCSDVKAACSDNWTLLSALHLRLTAIKSR